MANTEAAQPKQRGAGMNLVPVAVAVVTVGLFLGWLVTRRPAETVTATEPTAAANGAAPADAGTGQGTVIEPDALNQPDPLVGQVVELRSAGVITGLGRQMFWIELPGGSPYLVKLDNSLVAAGTAVPTGNVHLVGRVEAVNEALLNEWTQQGVLESENDRLQAEFSTTYIHATRVGPARQ